MRSLLLFRAALWKKTPSLSSALLTLRKSPPKNVLLSPYYRFGASHSRRYSGTTRVLEANQTIYALSSAPGKAGVAVIRASGPKCQELIARLAPRSSSCTNHLPLPRRATARSIRNPVNNDLLDRALIIFFPGPRSFTGEDVVEFHVHGGTAVVKSVLNAIGSVESCRMAERGEFAKRAFYNEKLDLTEAEGLADLLNAETEAQRRQALRQASGELKSMYEAWRTQLIQSLAFVEAVIDFGEDEQIEEGVYLQVQSNVRALYASISMHVNDKRRGEILRHGIHTVILGAPNAGKSSFLNMLAQRQASIVSSIPGTTRDVVELSIDVGGFPVVFNDTAGLRTGSNDPIEVIGIDRAKERIESADLKLCVIDVEDVISSSKPPSSTLSRENIPAEGHGVASLSTSSAAVRSLDPLILDTLDSSTILVVNKVDTLYRKASPSSHNSAKEPLKSTTHSDMNANADDETFSHEEILDRLREKCQEKVQIEYGKNVWMLSCTNGEGLQQFLQGFAGVLKDRFDTMSATAPFITHSRHREHLIDCMNSLKNFQVRPEDEVILAAEDLRRAAAALAHITGRLDVEAVLDVVFREFCIGK